MRPFFSSHRLVHRVANILCHEFALSFLSAVDDGIWAGDAKNERSIKEASNGKEEGMKRQEDGFPLFIVGPLEGQTDL